MLACSPTLTSSRSTRRISPGFGAFDVEGTGGRVDMVPVQLIHQVLRSLDLAFEAVVRFQQDLLALPRVDSRVNVGSKAKNSLSRVL